jgi:hypothetical protein
MEPVALFHVCCWRGVLLVGFTATLKYSSLPLLMPPLMPPALLVLVAPCSSMIASLCTLPVILAAAKPLPNSIPLMAGMEKMAWLITDSKELKNGSPMLAGNPVLAFYCFFYGGFYIGIATGFNERGIYCNAGKDFFSYTTCCHECNGKSAR